MRDAVIVEAVRTPVGKRNGGLSGVHPVDLSAHVLQALAERSGVSRSMISLIERGESSPTAVLLERLATGLSVPLAALFDAPGPTPRPVARRAD